MKRLVFILALVAAAVACSEPLSRERFVKAPGPYRFTVDMTDTSAVYAFDLYARMDVAAGDTCPVSLPLTVKWISPQDSVFALQAYLPLQPGQVYTPFMDNVTPCEAGVWELVAELPELPGFRGLGLVTRKEKWATEN